jgi:hypothetical protein
VNTATGVITINGLVPINDIAFPSGSTHVSMKGAWAKIDFATGVYDVQFSNTVNLPIDGISNKCNFNSGTASWCRNGRLFC